MRVLAIVPEPDAGPGVFVEALAARGAQLDEWSPPDDPAPPQDPGDYDAVIALGGAMHPDQESKHPWLADEKRLLARLVRDGVPVLGVCLGAQQLAEAVGGAARRAPRPEIGWYAVDLADAAAADPLLGPLGPRFEALEWHSYEFALPPGAVTLADSEICPQAFRLGETAWGIQFHAEVTATDLDTWIDDYGSDPDARGLDPVALRRESRAKIAGWNELGRALCGRFLEVAQTRD